MRFVEDHLPFVDCIEDIHLQTTHLAIGDNKEISASARRIQNPDVRQLVPELAEFLRIPFDLVEFSPQFVHEQRIDRFENVLLRSVMGTELTPLFGIHDALEQRPKYRRRNVLPIQFRRLEEVLPHVTVEHRGGQCSLEQSSVDIREFLKLRGHGALTVLIRGVQYGEDFVDSRTHAGAVLTRVE